MLCLDCKYKKTNIEKMDGSMCKLGKIIAETMSGQRCDRYEAKDWSDIGSGLGRLSVLDEFAEILKEGIKTKDPMANNLDEDPKLEWGVVTTQDGRVKQYADTGINIYAIDMLAIAKMLSEREMMMYDQIKTLLKYIDISGNGEIVSVTRPYVGWRCPECGKNLSPFVNECSCSKK